MNYYNYSKDYSEASLFNKIIESAKKAGIKIIYSALLLYFATLKDTTPLWVKATIIGALGYFICPIDAIPDFIPVAGYSDDLGVLTSALATASFCIDEQCKYQAKNKLKDWFGNYDEAKL